MKLTGWTTGSSFSLSLAYVRIKGPCKPLPSSLEEKWDTKCNNIIEVPISADSPTLRQSTYPGQPVLRKLEGPLWEGGIPEIETSISCCMCSREPLDESHWGPRMHLAESSATHSGQPTFSVVDNVPWLVASLG